MPRRPSATQARALEYYAAGEGAEESWDDALCAHGDTHLGFYRHKRTIESLKRHGWVDGAGITEAGRDALRRHLERRLVSRTAVSHV